MAKTLHVSVYLTLAPKYSKTLFKHLQDFKYLSSMHLNRTLLQLKWANIIVCGFEPQYFNAIIANT